MKLWLLKKTIEGDNQSPDCNTLNACIVATYSPHAARRSAGTAAGNEGAEFWMNKYNVTCIMISRFSNSNVNCGMVLADFCNE